MKLFLDEEIISTTHNNIVVLTNYRIRSDNSNGWGQRHTTSIMLEKISSIQTIYISYPILFVLIGLLILVSIVMVNTDSGDPKIGIPIASSFILLVVYFATRKHICIINSDGGGKIAFETSNINSEILTDFIDKIEQAKLHVRIS